MNLKINSLVTGLALVTMFIVTGCVSQGTYDDKMVEFNSALQKIDTLEKQNKTLQSDVTLARSQTDDVKKDLSNKQNELVETSAELQVRSDELEMTSDVLVETSDELSATKERAQRSSKLYSRLVKDLSSEVSTQKITIKQMKDGVVLNMPEGVLFDSGSAVVKESGVKVLSKVAKQLEDVPYQTIIGGYTDNVPISKRLATQFPSNWELAAVRATTVARKLEDSGIPKDRLVAVSFGETRPIASNETKEGRAQNRRIEIRLRPIITE